MDTASHKDMAVVVGALADRHLIADESDGYAPKTTINVPVLTAAQVSAGLSGVVGLTSNGALIGTDGLPKVIRSKSEIRFQNDAGTSLGGLQLLNSNAGQMSFTSQIHPSTGSPAEVFRYYWQGTPGSEAVFYGMGTNRTSFESNGAMVFIAKNARFEFEGNGSPRLIWSSYQASSAIGKSIEIGNSGQTVGQECVPLVAKTYVSGKNITEFRKADDALVAAVSDKGMISTADCFEGAEMEAPAAPAAKGYRIYGEDDGNGKTRLMVRFATGDPQQISIQP